MESKFKNDSFLKNAFLNQLSLLLATFDKDVCESDELITEVVAGYFELGFEEGLKAGAIYSKELKDLYEERTID